MGELVAACVAGVFELADGLRLVAARGRVLQALPSGGAMAAVRASVAHVAGPLAAYADRVAIAAVNAPQQVVLAGESAALEALLDELSTSGVTVSRLAVSHAFHSPLVEPALDELEQVAAEIPARPAQRARLIGALDTGKVWGRDEAPDARYWRRHAREAVQFGAAVRLARELGCDAFVELGPSSLLNAARANLTSDEASTVAWLPSLRAGQSERASLLHSLGALYVRGADVEWAAVAAPGRPIALPTTPFERKRYWLPEETPRQPQLTPQRDPDGHPLLGRRLDVALGPDLHVWQSRIDTDKLAYLLDHRVQSAAVYPATAYLEMVLAAANQLFGDGPLVVSNIHYHKSIVLHAGTNRRAQTVLETEGQQASFRILSRADDDAEWTLHATGTVRFDMELEPTRRWSPVDFDELRQRTRTPLSGSDFYRLLANKGNEWGPLFQGIEQLWRGDGEALSCVQVPEPLAAHMDHYQFHPAVSDACGHVLAAIPPLDGSDSRTAGPFVGGSIGEVRLYQHPRGKRLWTYARLRADGAEPPNVIVGDVQVIDEDGRVVSESRDARLWYLNPTQHTDGLLYEVAWEPRVATSASEAEPTSDWIVLADRSGIGAALAAQLGPSTRVLYADETGVGADDLERALDGRQPRGIVHPGALTHRVPDREEEFTAAGALDTALDLGTASAMHLVQALARRPMPTPPRVWLVTRGAQAAGRVLSAPEQAPIWGLGRTLALEHAELWGGLIDLDPGQSVATSAAALAAELRSAAPDDQVAFQADQRLVARLVLASAVPTGDGSELQLDAEAAYLVTVVWAAWVLRWRRGWSNVVLATSSCLADRCRRHARVPSNRPSTRSPPPKHACIHRSRMLPTLCSSVPHSRRLVPMVVRPYGASSTPRASSSIAPCSDSAPDQLHAVTRAKIQGAWLLHRLLPELDFFVVFSSASALLSSPRLAAYAAANGFLDALVHARASTGQRSLSVNWGVWSETGMATRFDTQNVQAVTDRGMGTLKTQTAVAALVTRAVRRAHPGSRVARRLEALARAVSRHGCRAIAQHLLDLSRAPRSSTGTGDGVSPGRYWPRAARRKRNWSNTMSASRPPACLAWSWMRSIRLSRLRSMASTHLWPWSSRTVSRRTCRWSFRWCGFSKVRQAMSWRSTLANCSAARHNSRCGRTRR